MQNARLRKLSEICQIMMEFIVPVRDALKRCRHGSGPQSRRPRCVWSRRKEDVGSGGGEGRSSNSYRGGRRRCCSTRRRGSTDCATPRARHRLRRRRTDRCIEGRQCEMMTSTRRCRAVVDVVSVAVDIIACDRCE